MVVIPVVVEEEEVDGEEDNAGNRLFRDGDDDPVNEFNLVINGGVLLVIELLLSVNVVLVLELLLFNSVFTIGFVDIVLFGGYIDEYE